MEPIHGCLWIACRTCTHACVYAYTCMRSHVHACMRVCIHMHACAAGLRTLARHAVAWSSSPSPVGFLRELFPPSMPGAHRGSTCVTLHAPPHGNMPVIPTHPYTLHPTPCKLTQEAKTLNPEPYIYQSIYLSIYLSIYICMYVYTYIGTRLCGQRQHSGSGRGRPRQGLSKSRLFVPAADRRRRLLAGALAQVPPPPLLSATKIAGRKFAGSSSGVSSAAVSRRAGRRGGAPRPALVAAGGLGGVW